MPVYFAKAVVRRTRQDAPSRFTSVVTGDTEDDARHALAERLRDYYSIEEVSLAAAAPRREEAVQDRRRRARKEPAEGGFLYHSNPDK